jgi:hypothetical protein
MTAHEIPQDHDAIFIRADGARFHVSLDGDDLWIHAQAPDGMTGPIAFEPNAGNEGWIKLALRPGIEPQPLRDKP